MSDEFKEFEDSTPTLSFGEPVASQAMEAPEPEVKQEPVDSAEVKLSAEELKQIDAFVDQIDIKNTQAVMNYGAGTQKKMADFSEKAMENVRTKDMGEVGQMIAGLVTELKDFDIQQDKRAAVDRLKGDSDV